MESLVSKHGQPLDAVDTGETGVGLELPSTYEEETAGKQYVLTEEDVTRIATIGAMRGIAEFRKAQEAVRQERTERVRNSAKYLMQHYRKLKRMEQSSVHGTDTVQDPTLSEIFEEILGEVRRQEFDVTSTKRNTLVTGVMMNHVDVQLENYRKECELSQEPEVRRRYRVIEEIFLQEEPMSPDDVAEIENIDKSSVYRTLEKAYDDLAALFFGIEALNVTEWRRQKEREKKERRRRDGNNRAKKTH